MTTHDRARPPRREDVSRHLEDLRTHTYEGAEPREARVELFRKAADLLDPVIREVLDETDAVFLEGTGEISGNVGQEEDGGWRATWALSWPAQREATSRDGGKVPAIQVMVLFTPGFTHPHFCGTVAGMWPCQVTSEEDARRQELIIRAITESELHQRILEGRWQIVPAFADRHAPAG
ncbi:MAG: hypothetical protein ACRDN9_16735 [Streptosporangiaceae bacterium]